MFGGLFKPGWKGAKAADRIKAIQCFNAANLEHGNILKELASTDLSNEVRLAAINSIVDIKWLSNFQSTSIESVLKEAIKIRLQKIISSGDMSKDTSLSAHIDVIIDSDVLMNIISHTKDNNVREKAISQIQDDDVLIKIIAVSKFHDARFVAAKQIKSNSAVETAHRSIKNKDKVVARLLQERMQIHKANLQKAKEHEELTTRLIASMDVLAKSQWSSEFSGRCLSLTQQWEKLFADTTNVQKEQFEHSQKNASEIVAAHQRSEKAHQQQLEIVQKLSALQEQGMCIEIDGLQAGIHQLEHALAEHENDWNLSFAVSSPEKEISEQYHRHSQSITKLRLLANKAINISGNVGNDLAESILTLSKKQDKYNKILFEYKGVSEIEQPKFIQQLFVETRELSHSIIAATKAAQSASQAVEKQFRSLQSMLATGKWGPANSIYQRLLEKLEKLDDPDRKRFDARLAKAEERLNEVGDWKSFATAPKLESLCEQMEALPSTQLSPRDRADWIKKLQDQWKSMGSSPGSNNSWPRFKDAADKAYAPCAEYFNQKRLQRERNLITRGEICEQLQTYFDNNDWTAPDWKLVQKTQRVAKQTWGQSRIVDRKSVKGLEDKFTQLMRQFDEKLDVEYTANAAEKQGLIDKVVALADGQINQHSLNQVKRYQLAWKQVGIMRRKEDQMLWDIFNETCRRVYNANREIQKKAYEKSIEHVTQAKDLLKEMNSLARNSDLDENAFTILQDKFQALPEFPDKDKKHLERDYQKAGDLFEKLRLKLLDAAETASLDDLRRRSSICNQLDQLLVLMPGEVEQAPGVLQVQWEDCDKNQKKLWLKAISRRYNAIISHLKVQTIPNYVKPDLDRRMLCIELEILTDTQTPAEDRTLRMEYQLGQLQQGLKPAIQGQRSKQLLDIEVRWLCIDGASQKIALALQDRFNTTLEKAHS